MKLENLDEAVRLQSHINTIETRLKQFLQFKDGAYNTRVEIQVGGQNLNVFLDTATVRWLYNGEVNRLRSQLYFLKHEVSKL